MKVRIREEVRDGYFLFVVEKKGWFGWSEVTRYPSGDRELARKGALEKAEIIANPEIIYVEKKL